MAREDRGDLGLAAMQRRLELGEGVGRIERGLVRLRGGADQRPAQARRGASRHRTGPGPTGAGPPAGAGTAGSPGSARGSRPPSAARAPAALAKVSSVLVVSSAGCSGAKRSCRNWARNSASTRPPLACLRFQGSSSPCSRKIRARIAATSRASWAGSRGWVSAVRMIAAARSPRRRVARHHAGAGQRLMLPGLGDVQLIALEIGQRAGDRPDIARRPQPGVDLVERALGGRRGQRPDQPLAEARVVGRRGQRPRAVGARRLVAHRR